MTRKSFLKRLSTIPILSVLWPHLMGSAGATSPSPSPASRVRPSDPGWPDNAAWEKLNQTVGGRLIKVESPLAGYTTADTAARAKLLKDLQNPFYIGDQPGATETTGWVDAWMSAPSVYAIAAQTTEDVVAGVNFARTNNLRLVVKGGGHSYVGGSNAADSLLIWTRAMNKVALQDAFVGQGCSGHEAPEPAVTVESGAMWIDAYHAVTVEGARYVQGGGCTTVGVAGLIQGGGFGSWSKKFGMAAAGLLEAEIVTADGEVRIANACTNSDLFWAIKGGGGGTFGVVTKLTLRTRDLPNFFGAVFAAIQAKSDTAFHDLLQDFIDFYRDHLFNPHWGETVSFRGNNEIAITMVFQGLAKSEVETLWNPFFDRIKKSPDKYTIASEPIILALPAQKFWDTAFLKKYLPQAIHPDSREGAPEKYYWWEADNGQIGKYWYGYKSTWLPENLLAEDQTTKLVDALFSATRHWGATFHFNKGLAGAPPEEIAAARDTPMNPAVLNAFALVIIGGGGSPVYPGIPGHEPDVTTARQEALKIGQAISEFRKIVPTPGSYVNETDYFEESWQESFWGPNYARLKTIKEKYDPTDLFFVHHGVGSENWTPDGFTRLNT
ncbi:MAG: FAD-binding oxidoreductase [Verrucomicrobia bacterium]|nr:FAD-binding oxidoreductase [Verrucomicrobiota bacterium]MBV8481474.1 FAD-binding oxidoreductase [Verrucomicrobiota bacterium]